MKNAVEFESELNSYVDREKKSRRPQQYFRSIALWAIR